MHICICGIRGVPACYGGFETFAEELGSRLVKRGHRVVVYGRKQLFLKQNFKVREDVSDGGVISGSCDDSGLTRVGSDNKEFIYQGMEIRLVSAPQHKYLETPVHTLFCLIDLLFNRPDVLLVCNAANSPFIWITRLARIPTAVNVDGIERKRAKWNWLGRMWYWLGEICSVLFASRLVADAEVIREYYQNTYRRTTEVITYGHIETERAVLKADMQKFQFADSTEKNLFSELELEPLRYFLYVSRLEPENNAHVVIQAYGALSAEVRARMPLVIVGDAPYADRYKQNLREIAGAGVIFAGYRFGSSYRALQLGAFAYIQATEVGGTHPALVEAMGFANCVVANDTTENREVLGESGLFYRKNDSSHLAGILKELCNNPEIVDSKRKQSITRARLLYSWDGVTKKYEDLFAEMART